MIEKLLKQANIPKEWWDLCSVENGIIHTPSTEVLYENGLVSEEEYQLWKSQQIDNCLEPTPEERITKLEEEKSILAENVYQLATILEVMLGGTESGQTETTTTDTAN